MIIMFKFSYCHRISHSIKLMGHIHTTIMLDISRIGEGHSVSQCHVFRGDIRVTDN